MFPSKYSMYWPISLSVCLSNFGSKHIHMKEESVMSKIVNHHFGTQSINEGPWSHGID